VKIKKIRKEEKNGEEKEEIKKNKRW